MTSRNKTSYVKPIEEKKNVQFRFSARIWNEWYYNNRMCLNLLQIGNAVYYCERTNNFRETLIVILSRIPEYEFIFFF